MGLCLGQQVAEGVEELFQPRLVPHALLDHLLLTQVLSTALDGQGLQGLNMELGQAAARAWGSVSWETEGPRDLGPAREKPSEGRDLAQCALRVGSPGPGSAGRCGTYSGGASGTACSILTCPARP